MVRVCENMILLTVVIESLQCGRKTPLSSRGLIRSKWNTNDKLTCEKWPTSLHNKRNGKIIEKHWPVIIAETKKILNIIEEIGNRCSYLLQVGSSIVITFWRVFCQHVFRVLKTGYSLIYLFLFYISVLKK